MSSHRSPSLIKSFSCVFHNAVSFDDLNGAILSSVSYFPKNKFQEIFGKLVNLSLSLVNQIKNHGKEKERRKTHSLS